MNTLQFTSSIKKEIWEYQKIFLWLPVIIAAFIILTPVLAHLLSGSPQLFSLEFFQELANTQDAEHLPKIFYGFASGVFMPFIIIAGLVQAYYFIACLFDERRDLSILFWRSLPVSDAMSIGVKLFVGALVLPAVFLLGATATLLIFLVLVFILSAVLSIGFDISLWGYWTNSDIVSSVLSMWLNLLPYTLWMLPLYAWLMLVSMFSSKAPFLWAIIPVVALLLIEGFVVHYFHFNSGFIGRFLMDYFSLSEVGATLTMDDSTRISTIAFTVLSGKISLVGLLLSAAFLYATYWLRANRSHS